MLGDYIYSCLVEWSPALHSDQVKNLVSKASAILQTGDTTLSSNEARNLVSSLLLSLCSHSEKNPYFAVAIFQHLMDRGFEMQNIRGEAMTVFMEKFGKKMSGVDETQRTNLRQVAERLFSPTRI